jgi:predicted porin
MKLPVSLHVALALAGSCAFAARAVAQPAPDAPVPLLEIYGTIVPFIEYGNTTDATAPGATRATQVGMASGLDAPARFRLDMGTSNLGFRGGMKLVDDLAVAWQVESGVQADGTPVANTIASRNSQIGLIGSWGTVFVGQWDTPYKWTTLALVNPIRAGFIPDYNGVLNGPGFGVSAVVTQPGRVAGAADAAFDRRQGNSVQYWTPLLHGLSARLAYGLDEGRTPTTAMAPSINPSVFSAALGYDRGQLRLRYAFELHHDYFGLSQQGGSPGATATNRSSDDLGHKLVASYTHAQPGFDTRVVGVFEYLRYKSDDSMPGAVDEHDRAAYYGLIDQTLVGKEHVWAAFGHAFDGGCSVVGGAPCATRGLGANEVVLGYIHRFSKSTDVFAAAYLITNKASASYSTFPPLGGPAAPGADVQGFGVGMLYQFSVTVLPPPPPTPTP